MSANFHRIASQRAAGLFDLAVVSRRLMAAVAVSFYVADSGRILSPPDQSGIYSHFGGDLVVAQLLSRVADFTRHIGIPMDSTDTRDLLGNESYYGTAPATPHVMPLGG
jgi:hypothetical protein